MKNYEFSKSDSANDDFCANKIVAILSESTAKKEEGKETRLFFKIGKFIK